MSPTENTQTQSGPGYRLASHLPEYSAAQRLLGIHDPDQRLEIEARQGRIRRRIRGRPVLPEVGQMTLREIDGVLLWTDGAARRRIRYGLRRPGRYRGSRAPDRVILSRKFETLEPSEITKYLEKFDGALNPHRGLRRLVKDGSTAEFHGAIPEAAGRRILVFIHGTFSRSEAILEQLKSGKAGQELIERVCNDYDLVLTFEHPTLSVSPVLNAVDLAALFGDSRADIDVISHSRGGLVTRWWLEVLCPHYAGLRRAILIGSPLAGTSLASPPQLRKAIGLFSNIADVAGYGASAASSVIPLMPVVLGLIRIVGSLSKLAAKTPLSDAVIAMVPGLAAQSRVGNNPELLRLQGANPLPQGVSYFAVESDFEPTGEGWKFWKYFCRPKERLADVLVDPIFREPNDMVVDTSSMTRLTGQVGLSGSTHVLSFGRSPTVHHLNYFSQPQTIEFIKRSFKLA